MALDAQGGMPLAVIWTSMEQRTTRDCRCSYVVALAHAPSPEERQELAAYLSALGVAGCEVVILDESPRLQFESNARVFRWVGKHVAVSAAQRNGTGGLDLLRAAADIASCEKVVVAAHDVRYTHQAITDICAQLEFHEVVEPQDYLDPLPWWGGIEAGRILLHRGIEPQPDHGATLAFRRSVISGLRLLHVIDGGGDMARRLESAGGEVYPASSIFVRREPGELSEWLERCPRAAGDDLSLPMKSFFFLSLLPILVILGSIGDVRLAASYAGLVAFASFALAVRGRLGAGAYFPLRACLFAPLWVLERSVSVYWAVARRLRGTREVEPGVQLPERRTGSKVASGE